MHERWIWCNVYPQHHYTIATKIQEMMTTFSNVTRYSRKNSEPYKEMESSFLQDMDQFFNVYCVDEQQKRQMEIRHCMRMAREDFTFYEDQRTEHKRMCVDEVVPLTQSDLRFRHDARQPSIPMSMYASASPSLEQCSAFASDSNNDTDGSASQLSETSEESIFTPQDSHPSHAQNRQRWTNLARMCERYQLSDRAGAAIATST